VETGKSGVLLRCSLYDLLRERVSEINSTRVHQIRGFKYAE